MLPRFPQFTKLELTHKPHIERITHVYPPYSDFNFTSLWTYNSDNSIEITTLNANLVVRFTNYITLKLFLSFIGRNKIMQTAKELTAYSNHKHLEPYLKLIPDVVITATPSLANEFVIEEDLDNHDYIVSASELAQLPEEKYKRKRYLVERFKRKYTSYSTSFLDLNDSTVRKKIVDLFVK